MHKARQKTANDINESRGRLEKGHIEGTVLCLSEYLVHSVGTCNYEGRN